MNDVVEKFKHFIEDALKDYLNVLRCTKTDNEKHNVLMEERLNTLRIRLESYVVIASNVTDYYFSIDKNYNIVITHK